MQLSAPEEATDRLVRADDPAAILQAVYSVMLARRRVPHVRREQRDQYLRECADAAGRKLSWGERLAAIERFWDAIDDSLDTQLHKTGQQAA